MAFPLLSGLVSVLGGLQKGVSVLNTAIKKDEAATKVLATLRFLEKEISASKVPVRLTFRYAQRHCTRALACHAWVLLEDLLDDIAAFVDGIPDLETLEEEEEGSQQQMILRFQRMLGGEGRLAALEVLRTRLDSGLTSLSLMMATKADLGLSTVTWPDLPLEFSSSVHEDTLEELVYPLQRAREGERTEMELGKGQLFIKTFPGTTVKAKGAPTPIWKAMSPCCEMLWGSAGPLRESQNGDAGAPSRFSAFLEFRHLREGIAGSAFDEDEEVDGLDDLFPEGAPPLDPHSRNTKRAQSSRQTTLITRVLISGPSADRGPASHTHPARTIRLRAGGLRRFKAAEVHPALSVVKDLPRLQALSCPDVSPLDLVHELTVTVSPEASSSTSNSHVTPAAGTRVTRTLLWVPASARVSVEMFECAVCMAEENECIDDLGAARTHWGMIGARSEGSAATGSPESHPPATPTSVSESPYPPPASTRRPQGGAQRASGNVNQQTLQ
uniref:Uncharacterized protein n=1 Tax=Chromera velia CCMP2878 TaxID=1169474 RepID=A0A0G4GBJ9_9ALVE|eukprot:Cvel_4442.t1-p1 / transcript=Cvel_4442.t1 / gene=Cvel_4442 / organism=Chromera_velia_CCMP2878 / gene_product=hypothetical protein / transcript_product=hypothetical protein / location=Cvel_scaffold193:96636-99994(-) / protein_length=498 / sequence_SO=supercontig / SO=protein_coding / is_pseudo=false